MSTENVTDSPTNWVNEHIQRYVESAGENGHHWNGVPTLLLTVRGRTSGRLRRTALIYGTDGDSYVIVASYGGRPQHPNWYLNLVADPEVRVQVGAEEFAAKARTATAEERARLWPRMAEIFPNYDEYQTKTDREIPVVILDPA